MSLCIDTGVETSSEVPHHSHSHGWCHPLDFFIVLLRWHLQAFEWSLAVQVVFFFTVDSVTNIKYTHLKIMFWLGTLARCPNWKWVRKPRWMAITVCPFFKKSLWRNHVVHQTTTSHYVSRAGVFNSRPAGRLRPSGDFCAAREGYFTKYNALWILKLESLDTARLQSKKFTARSKILNNYPKL